MVVHFSGTGNSRYCAEVLAALLEDEVLDSAGYIRHGIAAELLSGKSWVFAAPVYAWQIPRAFEQFLRSAWFQGAEDAWFVLTCGGDIGAAGDKLRTLCGEIGLRYRGVLEVKMPENYIALFDAPDEEKSREIVAAARPVLERAAESIRKGEDFPAERMGLLDRLKSGPVNEGFYKFYIKAEPFRTTEGCTACGLCAEKLCPLGNIRMEAGRPVWGENCTHCMACICGCPAEAIEYGKRSRGKRRYRCPEL